MLLMGREMFSASLEKQCVERCRSMWLLCHAEYEAISSHVIGKFQRRKMGERLDMVRLRPRQTDTSQQEAVQCGVLSGIWMQRRISRLLQWIPCKPTAGVVHHRGSRRRWGVLWARKQPNPNIWQQNEIAIHFHTSKELNQESETFDLSDSHPMLSSPYSCSVSTESTPAPGAVGRRQALAKRQGGATTLALIAYRTKPSTIFFGTITATSQLRTPSPRPRQLDRCVPRHHRDRDTLLATTTINQHRRHVKHTQPNPQIKPHPPQQCLPSATRTPPAHPPLPPQKDHQC